MARLGWCRVRVMPTDSTPTCDNRSAAPERWNSRRPLTHSLDLTKEGLGMKPTRICIADGCDREAVQRWLCARCYTRARRRGDLANMPRMKRVVTPTPTPDDWVRGIPSESGERWATVPGFPDYAASTHGRIFSRPRYGTPGGIREWCFPTYTKGPMIPYPQINLSQGGVHKVRKVHQLVLEAFVGPKPEGMEARHLDGDPMNPRLDNLEWATHAVNMADQFTHGTRSYATHCGRGHEMSGRNLYVSKSGRRQCRACRALREVRRRAAKRGAA